MHQQVNVDIEYVDGYQIPTQEGVYRIDEEYFPEIEVYTHPVYGLCVWCEDYGLHDPIIYQEGHIPVKVTRLNFIEKIRDL